MIQISLPASIPFRDFDYKALIELINPVADTVANATFRGADVDWFIKDDDLVLKKDKMSLNSKKPDTKVQQD